MTLHGLIVLLIVLACLGAVIWAANQYLPIPQPIKGIVLFLLVIVGVVIILNFIGVFHGRIVAMWWHNDELRMIA